MIKVSQVKVSILKDTEENLITSLCKKIHIKKEEIKEFKITKKSIDARDKNNIMYIYELNVCLKNENKVLNKKDVKKVKKEEYKVPVMGKEKLKNPIVVVGSGPAGLFAAYILTENNYPVIILERGEKIEARVKTVADFWQNNNLKINSNVQFGEGGAGTFSDGKLNTLVNDKFLRNKKVLETFVKFGAPEEILYLQKPHIGTDVLRQVIVNMRNAIIKNGGKFYYETCLTNIEIENNLVKAIEINNKEKIFCEQLILAIGHSARDTFKMLLKSNLEMMPKPFAVGIRIEHPQEIINEAQYCKFGNILPPASYKLTYTTKESRGVYSFCMCPGGYVVNSSSEEKRLAINGMSNYKRDSKNANSALVVTVTPKDFGENVLDGVEFQRNLEEKAYEIGNGNIPLQLYKDYLSNNVTSSFGSFKTEIKGKYTFANLNEILPNFVNKSLKEAIPEFGKKIKNFDLSDAILTAIESRTSSPLRIIRDENFESNIKGIYPSGEGAGYAGGITTSAMDGIKVAEAIIKKYSNKL